MVPIFIQQHLVACSFAVNMFFVAFLLLWLAWRRTWHAPGVRAPTPVIVTIVVVSFTYVACAAYLLGVMSTRV